VSKCRSRKQARRRRRKQRKAQRDRRDEEVRALVDDLQWMRSVLARLVHVARESSLRGPDVLRFVGTFTCAAATGTPPREVIRRACESPERFGRELTEWTLSAVVGIADVATGDDDAARADAVWVLAQTGTDASEVFGPDLGPSKEADLQRAYGESVARVTRIVSRVWGPDDQGSEVQELVFAER